MRTLLFSLLIFVAAFSALNAAEPSPLERFTFEERHMGTLFRLVLYAADRARAEKASRAAFERIAELDRILSDYKADSELMRLCNQAGGPAVAVSDDLYRVVAESQQIAKLSDGAFDITIGPVVRLWRKARRIGKLPDTDELKTALALVDYRRIELDPKGRHIRLLLAGMLLDLRGIGKGYTADAVLEVLRRHGITRALVAAGGDVAVGAAPPGAKGWRVGIAPLEAGGQPSRYLLLENAAVSTSGDLFQYVEIDGKRYSHIVDPKSGMGLLGRRSVTVVAPKGTVADGLDTAACILGLERGQRLIESREDAAALFVFEGKDGIQTVASKRFEKYLDR